VQIVKLELAAATTDVVYASSKSDQGAFKLLSWSNQSILSVFPDKVWDRPGDVELVGVRIGILSLLKLQDRPGAKLKILLKNTSYRERFK